MIIEEIDSPPSLESLARALHGRDGFFYLDSARTEGNSRPDFSFIGCDPFLTWRVKGEEISVESGGVTEVFGGEPLVHLRELMARYQKTNTSEIPFCGGAVGYFGYEFGARAEGVRPASREADGIPDAQFGFYDGVIACDLKAGKLYAVGNPVAGRSAAVIVAGLREMIRGALDSGSLASDSLGAEKSTGRALTSNLTHEGYLSHVRRIKEYIVAGDVYQVNLSQRFELATTEAPFVIYERLRKVSPAPFGAYLHGGGYQILSSSPELFLRIDAAGRAVTRPIKGTRPRGQTAVEDEQLSAELLVSDKDQAELLMIVDLERNDLGRVCRFGSVRVEERYRIEAHPTVFHLVATISGQLADGYDRFDCLRSMMPGGSITGAPKIRAMQIINELEPCRRNVYTGSIGYLGFDGSCDFNIAIRTILFRQGRACYQVGGGIVSDSEPEAEYQETLTKGRAMRAALLGNEKP